MDSTSYIPALRFNFLTRWYDSVVGLTMPERKFKQALIAQANVQPSMKVLDFGCGTLTLSLLLRTQNSNTALTAVDVDDAVLKIARYKNETANAGIAVIKYDGTKLPFPDNSFDRVLSSLVFHHLTRGQKANALREIHRVLKPGGELHIADWGKAASKIMRTLFYLVQLLDGFENTKDNVDGKLPTIICFAGFKNISAEQKINTVYGTLELLKATK